MPRVMLFSCPLGRGTFFDPQVVLFTYILIFAFHHIQTDFGFSLCSSFTYKDDKLPVRGYASILGALIRKHFPGIVKLPNGGKDVAWTWKHYSYAKDPDREYDNMQHKVICLF